MRLWLLLLACPALLSGAGHWFKFTSGPYEVYTDAGERAGRDAMVRFAEFRHAVSEVIGEPDLQTPLPVRIFVFSRSKGWDSIEPVSKGRVSYNIVLDEKSKIAPSTYSLLTELFLENASARLPAAFEHGLVEFFSTYSEKDIHISVGAPPASPDLDWARIHLLLTDPQYYGKLRVLVFNLRKGTADDPAYRNAFGKSAAEIDAEVKRHLAAGRFETTNISSLPMAQKDFAAREVSDADARLARADLLAGAQSKAEYEALVKAELKLPEAEEGLGLLALRAGNAAEARDHFAAAIQAQTTSARCYIEYAKLEPDNAKAADALLHAAGINPKLDEPFALLAERDTDPQKRLTHWKAAAERNPRNPVYWQKLADCYIGARDYPDASDAYTSGAKSAPDTATRDKFIQARIAIEQERLDYEAAERRRQAEEEAANVAKLKAQAMAEIRAVEDKYKTASSGKPMPYHLGPAPPASVKGTLVRVDCMTGGQARLTVAGEDKKTMRLLIVKPDAVSIEGPSGVTLGCGAMKRAVTIGYVPKANAKLSTAGEVSVIEFQ